MTFLPRLGPTVGVTDRGALAVHSERQAGHVGTAPALPGTPSGPFVAAPTTGEHEPSFDIGEGAAPAGEHLGKESDARKPDIGADHEAGAQAPVRRGEQPSGSRDVAGHGRGSPSFAAELAAKVATQSEEAEGRSPEGSPAEGPVPPPAEQVQAIVRANDRQWVTSPEDPPIARQQPLDGLSRQSANRTHREPVALAGGPDFEVTTHQELDALSRQIGPNGAGDFAPVVQMSPRADETPSLMLARSEDRGPAAGRSQPAEVNPPHAGVAPMQGRVIGGPVTTAFAFPEGAAPAGLAGAAEDVAPPRVARIGDPPSPGPAMHSMFSETPKTGVPGRAVPLVDAKRSASEPVPAATGVGSDRPASSLPVKPLSRPPIHQIEEPHLVFARAALPGSTSTSAPELGAQRILPADREPEPHEEAPGGGVHLLVAPDAQPLPRTVEPIRRIAEPAIGTSRSAAAPRPSRPEETSLRLPPVAPSLVAPAVAPTRRSVPVDGAPGALPPVPREWAPNAAETRASQAPHEAISLPRATVPAPFAASAADPSRRPVLADVAHAFLPLPVRDRGSEAGNALAPPQPRAAATLEPSNVRAGAMHSRALPEASSLRPRSVVPEPKASVDTWIATSAAPDTPAAAMDGSSRKGPALLHAGTSGSRQRGASKRPSFAPPTSTAAAGLAVSPPSRKSEPRATVSKQDVPRVDRNPVSAPGVPRTAAEPSLPAPSVAPPLSQAESGARRPGSGAVAETTAAHPTPLVVSPTATPPVSRLSETRRVRAAHLDLAQQSSRSGTVATSPSAWVVGTPAATDKGDDSFSHLPAAAADSPPARVGDVRAAPEPARHERRGPPGVRALRAPPPGETSISPDVAVAVTAIAPPIPALAASSRATAPGPREIRVGDGAPGADAGLSREVQTSSTATRSAGHLRTEVTEGGKREPASPAVLEPQRSERREGSPIPSSNGPAQTLAVLSPGHAPASPFGGQAATGPALIPQGTAPARPLYDMATSDPSLRATALGRNAHVHLDTGAAGALSLHLSVRDGVADLEVDGPAADTLDLRPGEIRRALAAEGLALGHFVSRANQSAEGQAQRHATAQSPAAAEAPRAAVQEAAAPSATPSFGAQSGASSYGDGRKRWHNQGSDGGERDSRPAAPSNSASSTSTAGDATARRRPGFHTTA